MRSAIVFFVVLAGCANDLRVDHPFDGDTSTGPLVSAEARDNGVIRLSIDATNKMSQVYVDLDEGREMKADEAFESNGWDLAFRRFDIFVNSGASNPAGMAEVAVLDNVDFDTLERAPSEGFQSDTGERIFNTVGGGWYLYDLGVHRLVTQEKLTYCIRSSQGAYFKLKMLSYYDANGTPASLSLDYASLAAP